MTIHKKIENNNKKINKNMKKWRRRKVQAYLIISIISIV